uniref:Uncharacterized protein n=1 Tax=Rhizophagus irregularis (strain DAOM 181602 / DAOM 197198 / MUCL 43194) TaxID=747089 RepID=U9TB01_RHIID
MYIPQSQTIEKNPEIISVSFHFIVRKKAYGPEISLLCKYAMQSTTIIYMLFAVKCQIMIIS